MTATRDVTDIYISVNECLEDSGEHVELCVQGAYTALCMEMWEGIDESEFGAVEDRTWKAASHLTAGLVARVGHVLANEIWAQQLVHGCRTGTLYAWRANEQSGHRPNKGDKLATFTHFEPHPGSSGEWCHILSSGLGGDSDLDLASIYITVPARNVNHWKKRVAAVLDELAAHVPT